MENINIQTKPVSQPSGVSILPTCDHGIRIPSNSPKSSKLMTCEDANEVFGQSFGLKVNFVPQVLIELALDYASQFINHCRDKRIVEFKKHNRVIKLCIEGYAENLAEIYGDEFDTYKGYVKRYFDYVDVDRFKMLCSIGNVVSKQLPKDIDRDGATLVAIIHKLIDYAEAYDKKMDKEISETLNEPVRRNQQNMLQLIIAMCYEFEETWGFKLAPDPIVDMNVGILANRALLFAEQVFKEETSINVKV